MTDRQGVFTYVNAAFERLYGYRADEVVGKTTPRILKSGHVEAASYARYWQRLLNGERVRTIFQNRTKSGTIVRVELSTHSVPSVSGEIAGFVAVQRDLSEREELETRLESQMKLLETTVENSPVAIALLDPTDLTFQLVNAAYRRFMPGTPASGRNYPDVWPSTAERDLQMFTEVVTTGMPKEEIELSFPVPRTPGAAPEQGVFSVSCIPVHLPDRARTSLLLLMTDITHRRQLEAQFLQVQKMDAVGRLAGGIAHDFNNLLTAIVGYSELLLDQIPKGDERRDYVEELAKAAQDGGTLTRQLLSFSRKQVIKPGALDLNAEVRDLERILERTLGARIRISLHLDPTLKPIMADRGQLSQVLMNLALNARDAMPGGGRLTIATCDAVIERKDRGPNRLIEPGAYTTLLVRDTGVGMPPEVQARLFEPFFTTKEPGKGTGFGLSTVYGIVKQCGGTIHVTSAPGRGSTFTLYFPVAPPQLIQRRRTDPQPAATPVGEGTILVVEDNDSVRVWTGKVLERLGYQVLMAGDAEAAVAICSAHPGSIDLLLTDVIMPGLNGFELACHVRGSRPATRVLYMSGYTDNIKPPDETERIVLLQKPFSRDTLAQHVRQMLAPSAA